VSGYGLHIFDQHAALLAASAISPEVARERGYVSAGEKTRLERAGFAKSQRIVPSLLIPIHGTDGELRTHQNRPDNPRLDNGKPRKYETPWRQPICLDVPRRVNGQLADPDVPLWITEGARKADAAVTAGLCCIALIGVDGWQSGGVALPDWKLIRLRDREVLIAYDSDAMSKASVGRALRGITTWLEFMGARVRHVILPEGEDGAKTGLDDYLAAGHDVAELAALARDPAGKPPVPAALPAQVPASVPVPPDPASLLDEVHEFLCAYVVFPSAAAAVAATLWAAHTHLVAGFESTPRLALLSPEKQCGKSRVLELLELLCAGAETLSDASPAYLYRRIGAGKVTILLDEADAIWKRGKADETAEALRSIVNAGHRRSATVGRVEMNGQAATLTRFRVYAPAAIAGIGGLPDTIMDRAVIVRMRRRAPDERIRDYRERTTRPEGEALRGQLAAWAADIAGRIGDPWPDMPPGVADRAADVWEPLLMVADLAGADWPKRAAEACTAFVTGAQDDTASTGTRLLADLRAEFGDAPQLFTQTILDRLHALSESPWADWSYGKPFSARDLADLLKEYQVRSRQLRIGEDSRKGYRRADLAEVWACYLPSRGSETSETSETPLASNVSAVSAVSAPRQDCTVCGEPLDPALAAAGYATHPMCDLDGTATP
jgi:hypothetical protein